GDSNTLWWPTAATCLICARTYHRFGCTVYPHTCGPCFDGYVGPLPVALECTPVKCTLNGTAASPARRAPPCAARSATHRAPALPVGSSITCASRLPCTCGASSATSAVAGPQPPHRPPPRAVSPSRSTCNPADTHVCDPGS